VNRVRWHLLLLIPELERSLGRGALNRTRALDRVDRRLRKLTGDTRAQIARELLTELRRLNRQIADLEARLLALIKTFRPQLLAELGCGPLVAAILIGHTAGVERFGSDASFALLSGTAPIPCSSGKRTQHRLNRAGHRQLHHALHIIAVTRASHDPATKAYLARKQAEGKTSKGALRCLKRTLARRFHRLLTDTPAPTEHERSCPRPEHAARPRERIDTAPARMHCAG